MVHDMHAVEPEKPILKAGLSINRSFIRFVNKTTRQVEISWINYDGERVLYKVLIPEETLNVDTFVGHPWVFRDTVTHQPLVVSSSEVFYPQPPKVRIVVGRRVFSRMEVHITIPVYSLKETCMHCVRCCLKSGDDAFRLEIPPRLQEELHQKWKTAIQHCLRS